MSILPFARPARYLTLAPALLRVGYALTEPAITELLLCDLLGRACLTVRPAALQPSGAYGYAYDTSLLGLPADTYLLALYCNGLRSKTWLIVVDEDGA